MNGNTLQEIVFSILILTIGGCLTNSTYQAELTEREKEKTKQMQIQARIDSIKAVNKQL